MRKKIFWVLVLVIGLGFVSAIVSSTFAVASYESDTWLYEFSTGDGTPISRDYLNDSRMANIRESTSLVEGHFLGTYSFGMGGALDSDDEVGTTGTDITYVNQIVTASTDYSVDIIDNVDGVKNVLKCVEADSEFLRVIHTLSSAQTSGTVEWKYRSNNNDFNTADFKTESDTIINLRNVGGTLKYYDRSGTLQTITTISADTWYRFKLEYDTSTEKISFYVDGVKELDDVDTRDKLTAGLSKITLYTRDQIDHYDGFGITGEDSDYSVGDNRREYQEPNQGIYEVDKYTWENDAPNEHWITNRADVPYFDDIEAGSTDVELINFEYLNAVSYGYDFNNESSRFSPHYELDPSNRSVDGKDWFTSIELDSFGQSHGLAKDFNSSFPVRISWEMIFNNVLTPSMVSLKLTNGSNCFDNANYKTEAIFYHLNFMVFPMDLYGGFVPKSDYVGVSAYYRNWSFFADDYARYTHNITGVNSDTPDYIFDANQTIKADFYATEDFGLLNLEVSNHTGNNSFYYNFEVPRYLNATEEYTSYEVGRVEFDHMLVAGGFGVDEQSYLFLDNIGIYDNTTNSINSDGDLGFIVLDDLANLFRPDGVGYVSADGYYRFDILNDLNDYGYDAGLYDTFMDYGNNYYMRYPENEAFSDALETLLPSASYSGLQQFGYYDFADLRTRSMYNPTDNDLDVEAVFHIFGSEFFSFDYFNDTGGGIYIRDKVRDSYYSGDYDTNTDLNMFEAFSVSENNTLEGYLIGSDKYATLDFDLPNITSTERILYVNQTYRTNRLYGIKFTTDYVDGSDFAFDLPPSAYEDTVYKRSWEKVLVDYSEVDTIQVRIYSDSEYDGSHSYFGCGQFGIRHITYLPFEESELHGSGIIPTIILLILIVVPPIGMSQKAGSIIIAPFMIIMCVVLYMVGSIPLYLFFLSIITNGLVMITRKGSVRRLF